MRRLLPLLLSLALLAGCAAEIPESSSREEAAVSPVYTDWSRLTEYRPPEEHYTRRTEAPMEELLPSEDYGPLLPYVGAVSGSWYVNVEKYGLITLEGEIVADPVYTSIYRPSFYDYGTDSGFQLPFWVLERSVRQEDGTWAERFALAALDGRWCTDLAYSAVWTVDEEHCLLLDAAEDLYLCGSDGQPAFCMDGGEMTQIFGEHWYAFFTNYMKDGLLLLPLSGEASGGSALVNLFTGEITYLPEVWYSDGWLSGSLAPARAMDGTWGYLRQDGSWAIPPQFQYAESFRGAYAMVTLADETRALIDQEGRTVLEGSGNRQLRSWKSAAGETGYLLSRQEGIDSVYTGAVWYDSALRDITPAWVEPDTPVRLGAGSLWTLTEEGTLRLFDGTHDLCLDVPEGFAVGQADVSEGAVILQNDTYDSAVCYTLQGKVLIPSGLYAWISPVRDDAGGTLYFQGSRYGFTSYDLYSAGGRLLAAGSTLSISVSHGLIHINDGLTDGYRNSSGDWVFRIRILDNGD